MPTLFSQNEWLDALLRGDKQQITRPQTTMIKVGDICNIYNQQWRRITDKPLRQLTREGISTVVARGYPFIPEFHQAMYHAHFLGKVEITKVYDIHPCEMFEEERTAWARTDGFKDSVNMGFTEMTLADTWFRAHHRNDDWMQRWWTVVQWHGWLERYFEPLKIKPIESLEE